MATKTDTPEYNETIQNRISIIPENNEVTQLSPSSVPRYNETAQMNLSSLPEHNENVSYEFPPAPKRTNDVEECICSCYNILCCCITGDQAGMMICTLGVIPVLGAIFCFPCVIIHCAYERISSSSLCTKSTPENNNGL